MLVPQNCLGVPAEIAEEGRDQFGHNPQRQAGPAFGPARLAALGFTAGRQGQALSTFLAK
jgi:hypothetical protein